jgi:hypothetical protein
MYLKRYKSIVNLIKKVLDIIGVLIFTIFVTVIFTYTKIDVSDIYNLDRKMDSLVDYQLELQYLDDYMEEPIDIEVFDNKTPSYFKKFIDLFSNNSYDIANLEIKHLNVVADAIQSTMVKSEYLSYYNERPQILSTVLKYHLYVAYQNISDLNNMISTSEISRIRKDILI